MPTPEDPDVKHFRCDACGRHFRSQEALDAHRPECEAMKRTGSGDKSTDKGRLEEGPDRDWVSTP